MVEMRMKREFADAGKFLMQTLSFSYSLTEQKGTVLDHETFCRYFMHAVSSLVQPSDVNSSPPMFQFNSFINSSKL